MNAQRVRPLVLLLLSLAVPAAADDRAALVELYKATNGAAWSGNGGNNGWLGSEPPCSGSTANWAGLVTSEGYTSGCSIEGRVVGL